MSKHYFRKVPKDYPSPNELDQDKCMPQIELDNKLSMNFQNESNKMVICNFYPKFHEIIFSIPKTSRQIIGKSLLATEN